MIRTKTILTGCLVATLFASFTLPAQEGGRRGRRGQRGPRPEAPQEAQPKKTAEKKKPAAKPVAYRNAVIHVGDTRVIRRGTIVIQGDKIVAVGRDVDVPKEATVVDCDGKHITPGFVICDLTSVGAPRGVGDDESYLDGIDPFNSSLKRALAAGITSYMTASTKTGSSPSGNSAFIKLVPGSLDGVLVKEPVVHAMSVPLGPDGWRKFEETLQKVRDYQKAKAEYDQKKAAGDQNAKEPKKEKAFESWLSVIEGKSKLRISATRSFGGGGRRRGGMFGGGGGSMSVDQIREALKIAKSLGVGVVLDNPTEAWIVADEIAATGSSCILMPRSHDNPDPQRSGPNGSTIEAPAILAKAGVPVTLLPPGGMFGGGIGSGGILGRDLNTPTLDPCFAVRGGMDEAEALSTLTLYPAMMLGVDNRVGSLEPGKDADLLILDGDPLHYKTFVETAIVNGKVVYEKAKEPFYRHIRSNH